MEEKETKKKGGGREKRRERKRGRKNIESEGKEKGGTRVDTCERMVIRIRFTHLLQITRARALHDFGHSCLELLAIMLGE